MAIAGDERESVSPTAHRWRSRTARDDEATDVIAASNFHVDVEGPCDELVSEAATLFSFR